MTPILTGTMYDENFEKILGTGAVTEAERRG